MCSMNAFLVPQIGISFTGIGTEWKKDGTFFFDALALHTRLVLLMGTNFSSFNFSGFGRF